MSLVDELRARRGDRDDPFDQEEARRDFTRGAKRSDSRTRKLADEAKREGRDEERRRAEARADKRRDSKRAPRRRSSSRRSPGRRAARQLAAPVRSQIVGGLEVLTLTLLVVGLYLVLTTQEQTGAVSGVLDGLAKGLRWLSDPTRSLNFGS